MKKLKFFTIAAFLLLSLSSAKTFAKSNAEEISTFKTVDANANLAKSYIKRLEEINELDKSSLSPPQRKTLRIEVKSIQKRLQQLDGGIYISVGAIIIILLLLIILF